MSAVKTTSGLERRLYEFVRKDFSPSFNQLQDKFSSRAEWERLQQLGTQLWLDSGNIDEISKYWTREFTAVTVNNTLLNKEVQAGRLDSVITEAINLMNEYPAVDYDRKMLELALVLNAWQGLRLVEKFDGSVSLEEHTDLADDVDAAVDFARRIYAICPERFFVKIPFTPAGLLATRKLSAEGVPVNLTLGFSARQNYLTARIAKPAYVNVFLGRLNSLIVDNKLGDGSYIGEKATLASQKAIRELRKNNHILTHQIGASFRNGRQVLDLAGLDVMTIPPKVAGEFLDLKIEPEKIVDKTGQKYTVGIDRKVNVEAIRLNTLWDIDKELVSCIDDLENENLDSFTPDDLIDFFKEHHCADVLVNWDDSQNETSYWEGKIPNLSNWKNVLESKEIGLDSLMNLAGLNSFRSDQNATDEHIKKFLDKGQ